MNKFEESNFYKALQDFFINADKKTFLQFLAEFYNRTEGIIGKNNIQDDLIKELRELYLELNEKGIDDNIVREKVNYFLENSVKIKDIISKLSTNTNKIENINSKLNTIEELTNTSNIELIKTKRIAHRGYSGLAPENTIPAYEKASEYDYWGGECDVAETLDHEFVLMHDDTIDRTTNGTGNVSNLTLSQLKEFNIDSGSNINSYPNLKIPTLQEYLETCKNCNLIPVIEVKTITDNSINKFLDIIRSYGLIDKAIVISFNYDLLVKIRNKEKRLLLQPLLPLNETSIEKCVALGANTHIDCPETDVTLELVELAHKKGLLVNAWTVNDKNKLKTLVGYGVDFITTDVLYDEETLKNKIKTIKDDSSSNLIANQISSIQLGSSANTTGVTYEELINKSSLSNRCSTVNRFYRALNDTVVINMPSEYKLTLMPFDSNGLYLRDYGWFNSGETDISSHKNVDHYHIYFARVDGANFTDEDIANLKEKVSITFKTKTLSSNTRKYMFFINQAPMVLNSDYSSDTCTVEYEGDSSKLFVLTHGTPITGKFGVSFGNVSLTGDMNIEVRTKSESKTGLKFGFIDRRTTKLMTKAEIEAYGWFYFNIVHIG